ncbi:GlcG/HbpS family heme-binding protein [Kaarinaea lacus]
MKYLYGLIIMFSVATLNANADSKEAGILFTTKSLTPEAALTVAKTALDACRKAGMQVTVAVVDKGGNEQVVIRDRIAGMATVEAAIRKARTSATFRVNSTEVVEAVNTSKDLAGIKHLSSILAVGGGIPIQASGETVGAVGVAGAPDSKVDEECGRAGIEAIQDMLEFAE